eukprot:3200857-Amphidinium_carterae.1
MWSSLGVLTLCNALSGTKYCSGFTAGVSHNAKCVVLISLTLTTAAANTLFYLTTALQFERKGPAVNAIS